MSTLRAAIFSLSIIVPAVSGLAQDMEVPVDVQLQLLGKILTFERTFATNKKKEVVLGLIYQEEFRTSRLAKEQVVAFLASSGDRLIENAVVRVMLIDAGVSNSPLDSVFSGRVDLFYVAPLRSYDLALITQFARQRNVLTFTGVPEYVERGLTIGIGLRLERPLILINIRAAKAEGKDFSARFLNLARVIE